MAHLNTGNETMEPAAIADAADFRVAAAGDYFALLKPRVMSLVVFTAFVGLMVAPGPIHPVIAFAAILCIAVGAGAAGALNMRYDVDIDRLMSRTRTRPVAAGRIEPGEALGFGLFLAVASVLVCGVIVNWAAASLLAFTIFFYIVVYTWWLKRRTPHNIVIGGAAGAFPPMIGWMAVTGGTSLDAVLLFLLIFVWTPPHSWALALCKADDYARAGVPMLPVVSGVRTTKVQIFAYSVLLAPVGVAPWFSGLAGPVYGAVAAVLGAAFVGFAGALLRASDKATPASARRVFAFSVLYLVLLFSVLLAETGFGAWS